MDPSQKICVKCGYELVGRGTSGTCPECGQYWDLFSGKGLQSDRAGQRQKADRMLARLRTIALAVGAVLMLGCGGGLSFMAANVGGNPLRPLAIAGAIAGLLVLAAVTSYFYEDGGS